MVQQLQGLLALDLAEAPELEAAVAALRPAAEAVLRPWPALAGTLQPDAALDAVFPAFDLESFDGDLGRLEYGIRGHDEALTAAVVAALTQAGQQRAALENERTQRDAELSNLQQGRSPAPDAVRAALDLIEREIPLAHPHILAQLVEPKAGSTCQNAIEGNIGGDRFALIVDAGLEAKCTRLVKRKFPVRSPKVVQGSKAIEDTRGRRLDARAVMHELVSTHPVAKAFLLAQYGRVRKVDTEDELARTAQGLMEEGIGSRGYGMFACRAPDHELAFGEAARKRRMAWCEQELSRLDVTFERMADARGADWQHSLLIYAAGFKGSAKRLRHRSGCRIYLRASHADALALEPSAARGLEAVGGLLPVSKTPC